MNGIITFRHVIAHPVIIVRGWGWRVFGRCLIAATKRTHETFLSIISR
jgi:hypothetical protein